MAYAYKRGKRWYVGFVNKLGEPDQIPTRCATQTEAKRFAQDLERKHERLRLGLDEEQPEPMTLAELSDKYLVIAKTTKRSFATIKQRIEAHILPALGSKLIHQIVPADIDGLLAAKVDQLGPQSREHLRVHLQAMFTFAIEGLEVLSVNPASKVKKVKVPKRRPKVLPKEAVPAILAAAYDEFRDIMATALFTGLRKGEVLGLKRQNVLLEQRMIVAENSYASTTKGDKSRVVPIPEVLVPYLEHALGRQDSEWAFPNEAGEMRTRDCDLADIFKRAMVRAGIVSGWHHICRRCRTTEERENDVRTTCKACGMKLWVKGIPQAFSFKDLRSTFGTNAYELTGDIRFVQEVLGHHNVKTTEEHYAQFRPTHLLEQTKKLNAAPTYAALTNDDPHGRQTVGAEEIVTVGQPLTTTRSRGLEPLTSGVTGQGDVYSRVVGGGISLISRGVNNRPASSGLPPFGTLSSAVTDGALTDCPPGCLSVSAAADVLGVSIQRVYQLLGAEKLSGIRKGNRVWVRAASVKAYGR